MPEHIEDYRGIEIRRRKVSRSVSDSTVIGEEFYGIADNLVVAKSDSVEGVRQEIDQILNLSSQRTRRKDIPS
jgi:hypothetical protein